MRCMADAPRRTSEVGPEGTFVDTFKRRLNGRYQLHPGRCSTVERRRTPSLLPAASPCFAADVA
ncbi:protein of unknown function [Paraburkholderia kururiensis]